MRVSIGLKPFLHGLFVVAFIYAALFGFILTQTSKTYDRLETKLSSLSVPIERTPALETLAETVQPMEQAPLPTHDLDTGITTTTDGALRAAPVEGLFESNAAGNLPKKGPDGLTPFAAYRRPFIITGQAIIAIVVDDFGLSDSASTKAIGLPADVSFMLSSYSSDPQKWANDARMSGHELWMKVNFETADYPASDPGPQALLSNASLKYNEDRLVWNMTRASGYAGIAGGTDYIFESASSILQPLIKYSYNRGLGYLETNNNASPLIETLAVSANAPYAKADTLITGNDANNPFEMLERTARERGFAIAILKPNETALTQLKTWSDTLSSKGIKLAPVSAIAALPLAVHGMTVEETEEEVQEAPAPAEAPHAPDEGHH